VFLVFFVAIIFSPQELKAESIGCCLISEGTEPSQSSLKPVGCRRDDMEVLPCDTLIKYVDQSFYRVEVGVSCTENYCVTCNDLPKNLCIRRSGCFFTTDGSCLSRFSNSDCSYMQKKTDCIVSDVCKWNEDAETCYSEALQYLDNVYDYDFKAGILGTLPKCAKLGTCNSPNDIVVIVSNAAGSIFKYIGAIVFAFFVFGGGLMVLSFGNAERFKQGQNVLVASVIGMVIVFAGYFIVGFLLDVLGVSDRLNVFK